MTTLAVAAAVIALALLIRGEWRDRQARLNADIDAVLTPRLSDLTHHDPAVRARAEEWLTARDGGERG